MNDPLNPSLFKRLERYYGVGEVEIVSPGEAIDWKVNHATVEGREHPVASRDIISSGEEYKVRCKACLDHRARLLISHMWGVYDEETNSHNLWALQCFNEQCYTEYEDQKILYDAVYCLGNQARNRTQIKQGRIAKGGVLQEVRPPGTIWRLDTLAKKLPGCDALTYLEGRGFDPERLAKHWDVGYCLDSRLHYATDRIYVPIQQNGFLAGWQCRYIGDNVDGVSFNRANVPKYYSCPGMQRRLMAYNLERALKHPTVVIVEGPADAWRVGPMAIACIGKTLSPAIRERIVTGMRQHGSDGVLVIMLDPKQDPVSLKRGKPHHIQKMFKEFADELDYRVVPVYLPEDLDPGATDREWLREIMREAAGALELKLSFSKPVAV